MRDKVFEDLNAALEGDYHELLEWSPLKIAHDLINYSDYPDVTVLEIVDWVSEWKKEKANA